jgi:hypothetical protein
MPIEVDFTKRTQFRRIVTYFSGFSASGKLADWFSTTSIMGPSAAVSLIAARGPLPFSCMSTGRSSARFMPGLGVLIR